jgi:LMBR1 domain-containing protein 1
MKSSKIDNTIKKRESNSAFSWRIVSKVLAFLTPFRIMIGVGCLAMSLIIVSSIIITNIDRFFNSKCGFACGYIIETNNFFNPLDSLLVQLSKVFPIDLVFIGFLLLYVFLTCLYGLIKLGIKFLCFNVFLFYP